MIRFPIDPEFCLILNAFSHATTLRGAASLLGTDPPSLVRKVRRLVSECDYLIKVGNRWVLTESGRRVAQWTEGIISEQAQLKSERQKIRIGSYAWLAEEILIPELSKLELLFEEKRSWDFNIASANLEHDLIESRVDFIVTGYAPKDPSVMHRRLKGHPWVAIAPPGWKRKLHLEQGDSIKEFMRLMPFVRHTEVNPERYLDFVPDVIFNCTMDGVVGVRSAVLAGHGWSIVPGLCVRSHLREGRVLKVELPVKIKDDISLWWLRDRKDLSRDAKVLTQWLGEY